MYILHKTWRDDYLDYHMSANEVQVSVQTYWPLQRLDDLFFEQPRSLYKLWNYLWEVGPVSLVRRVRSRRAERLRNTCFIAIGLGTVNCVGSSVGQTQPGQAVIFIAPGHPQCLERLVLPPELVAPATRELMDRLTQAGSLLLFEDLQPAGMDSQILSVAGWSSFSGRTLPPTAPLLEWARRMLSGADRQKARTLPLARPSVPCEVSASPQMPAGLNAVVFGLGNYVKTTVQPNIDPRIHIVRIHEIDPTQIGRLSEAKHVFDTCPVPRPDEKYDIYFIASYHHTHTPLAVHALSQGAWAVIEKPLVTSHEQLDQLVQAMRQHPGKVFAGYHMRHSPLLALARQDLRVVDGQPVNYHCMVFEMPLPSRHWYRWPNSRSRLTSNGCHWLDQFLCMNNYSPHVQAGVWRARNDDVHVSVELANGASFNMVLTEIGSRRLGVQDNIEMRAGDITVRIINDGDYHCENTRKIVRRKRINKTIMAKRLYRNICGRILSGQGGDTLQSVERTHRLLLEIEDALPRS